MKILDVLMGHMTALAKAAGPPTEQLKTGIVNAVLRRDGYQPVVIDLRHPRKVHTLGDVVSLCDYLGRHGNPARTTVFCTADRFIAVLDDNLGDDGDGDRDWIEFKPERSTPLVDWLGAFQTGVFSHIDFRNFIEDRKDHLEGRSFVAAVKEFAVNQSLEYDSDLSKGEHITIKTSRTSGQKTESGVVELDREFTINIPLVVGWEKTYAIKVRVEADLRGSQVQFQIGPKNLTEVMHELLNDLVAHLGATLGEGWLVVRGAPKLAAPLDGNARHLLGHPGR